MNFWIYEYHNYGNVKYCFDYDKAKELVVKNRSGHIQEVFHSVSLLFIITHIFKFIL